MNAADIMIAPSLIIGAGPSGENGWVSFGFDGVVQSVEGARVQLPAAVVAIGSTLASREHLVAVLGSMQVPPQLITVCEAQELSFFRISDPSIVETIAAALPGTVKLYLPGAEVKLPPFGSGSGSIKGPAVRISDLSVLHPEQAKRLVAAQEMPEPENRTTLTPFSLRGHAATMEDLAQKVQPLLGEVCMSGQATIWYAPPNAGKTLLALNLTLEAIEHGRIKAENVYYINADDSSSGVATKLQILDEVGAHTLVPGYLGFKAPDLVKHLDTMATKQEATGTFIIIDTAKKFTSLMEKKDAAAFADVCRRFVMRGGTVLSLAHTTKNPNADGRLRYAGTTDLLEDSDAAYILTPLEHGAAQGERVVQFAMMKRRGSGADFAAYAYVSQPDASYHERLASVRPIDPDQVDEFQRIVAEVADAEVISVALACIAEGINTKMALAKEVGARSGVSKRQATRVLEGYTGTDPTKYRWKFVVGERGAKLFEPLAPS